MTSVSAVSHTSTWLICDHVCMIQYSYFPISSIVLLLPQGKLPGNTGLDGHRHRQNYSVIAPYACRFESVVGTLEDGLMHSFFAIVA